MKLTKQQISELKPPDKIHDSGAKYWKATLSNEDYRRMFMAKDRGEWSVHGLTGTRLRRIYSNMKQRCSNPNNGRFEDYGGRGISVCTDWICNPLSFFRWAIDNGYGDHLTIDRKDNDGDYTPSNCHFVSMSEQSKNKRRKKRRHDLPEYISKRKDTGAFVVRIVRDYKLVCRKQFKDLDDAISYRDEALAYLKVGV
jgi:hypothetical protein